MHIWDSKHNDILNQNNVLHNSVFLDFWSELDEWWPRGFLKRSLVVIVFTNKTSFRKEKTATKILNKVEIPFRKTLYILSRYQKSRPANAHMRTSLPATLELRPVSTQENKHQIRPDFFRLVLSTPPDQKKLKILHLFIIWVTDHKFKLEQKIGTESPCVVSILFRSGPIPCLFS